MKNTLIYQRRDLLRLASAGGFVALTGSPAFAASDFWNKKPASDWSVAEVEQLKTKSPWARKVRGEMPNAGPTTLATGSGGRGSRGGAGGMGGDSSSEDIGGGGGGGGRGGRGGGGDFGGDAARSAVQAPEVVIRWENAKPILDATNLKLPQAMDNHYAISVTGLPPEMLAAFARGRGSHGPHQDAPADAAAREKAAIDRIKASASLTAKGKDPASADLLMQTIDRQTMIFGFPKDALPLTPEDKDVLFTLQLFATFKAKFQPKEMMYQGKLAV